MTIGHCVFSNHFYTSRQLCSSGTPLRSPVSRQQLPAFESAVPVVVLCGVCARHQRLPVQLSSGLSSVPSAKKSELKSREQNRFFLNQGDPYDPICARQYPDDRQNRRENRDDAKGRDQICQNCRFFELYFSLMLSRNADLVICIGNGRGELILLMYRTRAADICPGDRLCAVNTGILFKTGRRKLRGKPGEKGIEITPYPSKIRVFYCL